MIFTVLSRPAPSLAMVEVYEMGEFDTALWTCAKARKSGMCCATGKTYKVGDEVYRPVGSKAYRMRRALASYVDSQV